jgi:hypothetical protein
VDGNQRSCRALLASLLVLSAGTIVYQINIDPPLCSAFGNLNGGAASTILDQLTLIVLHMDAKPGYLESRDRHSDVDGHMFTAGDGWDNSEGGDRIDQSQEDDGERQG